MSKEETGYIFVYGTLKKGQDNFNYFLSKFVIDVEPAVVENAAMYDLGRYPAVVLNRKSKVVGQLMKVNDIEKVLKRCDYLEGYNPESKNNLFNRVQLKINGVFAWMYVFNKCSLIEDNYEIVEEWKREVHYA